MTLSSIDQEVSISRESHFVSQILWSHYHQGLQVITDFLSDLDAS